MPGWSRNQNNPHAESERQRIRLLNPRCPALAAAKTANIEFTLAALTYLGFTPAGRVSPGE